MCHAAAKLRELSGLECVNVFLLNIKWDVVGGDERKFEKCIKCTFWLIIQAVFVNKWWCHI